jgi:hypothetical protein
MAPILVGISPGELLDRISILQLKSERIQDATKPANVRREPATLWSAGDLVLNESLEVSSG